MTPDGAAFSLMLFSFQTERGESKKREFLASVMPVSVLLVSQGNLRDKKCTRLPGQPDLRSGQLQGDVCQENQQTRLKLHFIQKGKEV